MVENGKTTKHIVTRLHFVLGTWVNKYYWIKAAIYIYVTIFSVTLKSQKTFISAKTQK